MAADITLALLRPLIRDRGDYQSSLTFNNTYVNSEAQAAFRELYELVDEVHEGWWDTSGTISTVASQAYVALPTGCWRVRGIDIAVGDDWRELNQIGIADRNRYGSGTAKPSAYRLSARGAELFATPDAIYSLRVTYTPVCPALSESAGIELYGWQEYIIVGALLRLDTRSKRPLGERQQELERQRQRVIQSASKRKSQEPEYLQLREGGPCNYEDPF